MFCQEKISNFSEFESLAPEPVWDGARRYSSVRALERDDVDLLRDGARGHAERALLAPLEHGRHQQAAVSREGDVHEVGRGVPGRDHLAARPTATPPGIGLDDLEHALDDLLLRLLALVSTTLERDTQIHHAEFLLKLLTVVASPT